MNTVFRVVRNHRTGFSVVTSELASAGRGSVATAIASAVTALCVGFAGVGVAHAQATGGTTATQPCNQNTTNNQLAWVMSQPVV